MPDEISTDTLVRVRLWTIIPLLIGLLTGVAGAVGAVYRVRDGLLTTAAEQRTQELKNYPSRDEMWQALGRINQKQDAHYNDLKDRITGLQDKVDGVVIFLRKRL